MRSQRKELQRQTDFYMDLAEELLRGQPQNMAEGKREAGAYI